MRVGILGRTVVWDDRGSQVPLRPQLRALLARLAVDPGEPIPVDQLTAALRGDPSPARPRNALQAQVSRLRRAIGSDLVEHTASGYRLLIDPDAVDAHRFERLVEHGRRGLTSGDPDLAGRSLAEAVHLWRGPALADLEDTGTAVEQIGRLEELRLLAAEHLAEADLARGAAAETIPRLRGLVTDNPLRERGWTLLLRALAADGRRAEAMAVFVEAREIIADELGTDPSPELADAHLSVLRDAGPGADVRGPPAPLTTMIGRGPELDRVRGLLAGSRLITLTGPGGSGKTRLAIEAAREADPPACFVELAAVSDAGDVPLAVASALGLRRQGRGPGEGDSDVVSQLRSSLVGRRLLLVLDNCEHLTTAVARLAGELLAACPSLHVLATSREPLGVTGEALVPVTGLAVPPSDHARGVEVADARAHPAVRLLEDRVALARPGFTVDGTTVDDAVRICQLLDGLPLAIELAAARARSRSLAAIAQGLDAPFDLLSRGDPAGDPRHRSLASVISWSWDLLVDAERDLLSRFSVFAGGATPADISAVCDVPEADELLAGLVDQSLLTLHEGRYRMLSTIAAFAGDRLEDPKRWRDRHAEHYLRLAHAADPHLRGRDQLTWLRRLDDDYPNLRTALIRSTCDDPPRALRLAHALATYWWLRGRRHDGAVLCQTALAATGTRPPEGHGEEYVLAVLTAADEADPLPGHLEAIARLVATIDRPPRQPLLTIAWARQTGPTPSRDGPLPPPPAHLLGSDPWSHALGLLSDGLQQLHRGDAARAEESLVHALEGFRSVGERWGTLKALAEASRFPAWRGEHARAIDMLEEAADLASDLSASEEVAERYWQIALCHTAAGAPEAARTMAARAVGVAEATGLVEVTARALAVSADVFRATGELAAAREAADQAADIVRPGWVRISDGGSETRLALGRLAVAEGRPDEAMADFSDLLDSRDALVAAAAVEGLATVAAHRGDGARAAHLLGAAAVVRGTPRIGDLEVERMLVDARGLIGAEAVDAAYGAGYRATREGALTGAREGRSAHGQ